MQVTNFFLGSGSGLSRGSGMQDPGRPRETTVRGLVLGAPPPIFWMPQRGDTHPATDRKVKQLFGVSCLGSYKNTTIWGLALALLIQHPHNGFSVCCPGPGPRFLRPEFWRRFVVPCAGTLFHF